MSDVNYKSYADCTGLQLQDLVVDPSTEGLDASLYDDLFKLSHVTGAQVTGLTVRGQGKQLENAIDMNRVCTDIVIENARLEAGLENAITIKGGCKNVTLRNITIERAGGHCDIELGNWSDQSPDPVTGVHLINVARADGQPVRVRVGHADRPTIEGGNVKILFWASLALKAYWWTCRFKAWVFRAKFPVLMP